MSFTNSNIKYQNDEKLCINITPDTNYLYLDMTVQFLMNSSCYNRWRFNIRVCDQLVVDRCNTQPWLDKLLSAPAFHTWNVEE